MLEVVDHGMNQTTCTETAVQFMQFTPDEFSENYMS